MKTYLGDGLYAQDSGFQFRLSTPEGHEVYLDAQVLQTFLEFIERSRSVKITVTKVTREDGDPESGAMSF